MKQPLVEQAEPRGEGTKQVESKPPPPASKPMRSHQKIPPLNLHLVTERIQCMHETACSLEVFEDIRERFSNKYDRQYMLYSNDHYPHHGVQRDPIKPTRSQHHRQPTDGRKEGRPRGGVACRHMGNVHIHTTAHGWTRVVIWETYIYTPQHMDGRSRETDSVYHEDYTQAPSISTQH